MQDAEHFLRAREITKESPRERHQGGREDRREAEEEGEEEAMHDEYEEMLAIEREMEEQRAISSKSERDHEPANAEERLNEDEWAMLLAMEQGAGLPVESSALERDKEVRQPRHAERPIDESEEEAEEEKLAARVEEEEQEHTFPETLQDDMDNEQPAEECAEHQLHQGVEADDGQPPEAQPHDGALHSGHDQSEWSFSIDF